MAKRRPEDEEAELDDGAAESSEEEEAEAQEEEEEEDDDDDEKPVAEPRKDAIYDVSGLVEKLEEIAWPEGTEWMHSLSTSKEMDKGVNVEDDLAREMAFYTLAVEGARQAYDELKAMGIPFLRPEDYYAEMVKSDKHMLKVKGMLVSQQKKLEEEQERRKAREAKKFAKEVQAEKLKERTKQKKQDIEAVNKWRKMRQKSDFSRGEDQFPLDLGEADGKNKSNKSKSNNKRKQPAPWDRSGGKNGKAKAKSKGRQQRDSKFGYGGRKGMKKRNTADSSADVGAVFGSRKKKQKR